jgi:hypothetical protein
MAMPKDNRSSLKVVQVTISKDPIDGATFVVIQRTEDHDQWAWVADKEFGPFDDFKDVATWIWARLTLDRGYLVT